MDMPTSILAVVAEVVDATTCAVIYGGNYYEATIMDATLVPVVGDVVVCEALPNARQWIIAAIKS